MDTSYHDFRRQVLLARQAYLEEREPAAVANHMMAAARMLLLLTGGLPPGMLRGINRQALLLRLEQPDMAEPVRLLRRARRLAKQAGGMEREAWREQAYPLLWRLDRFLIELAPGRRRTPLHWMPRAYTCLPGNAEGELPGLDKLQ